MVAGLAGRKGILLRHLLDISMLDDSTCYRLRGQPGPPERHAHVRELIRRIWRRVPNGMGYRQMHLQPTRGYGISIDDETVRRLMRRMGLKTAIRGGRACWRSYRGDRHLHIPNLLARDFRAAGPFEKLGTDVSEFAFTGGKAYLAIVYDMGSKEIVCWQLSRSPGMAQQRLLLRMLARRLPAWAHPILHSDMGWQYQHPWWVGELRRMGIRQSMSRKGNCLDNAATEQVFGHMKDEFYRGRTFDGFRQLKREMARYARYWNTRRRQEAIGGMTPVEYRKHAERLRKAA